MVFSEKNYFGLRETSFRKKKGDYYPLSYVEIHISDFVHEMKCEVGGDKTKYCVYCVPLFPFAFVLRYTVDKKYFYSLVSQTI